ncbi:glycosyltransferase family 2 protein [Neolewinella antarctica]|uniref:Glycosyltransferase involved in cell wall biosynthesis n=1 Tax=Neolewinella antarctica TaxID=442734 RepID=A0ABX0XAZ6_9BACT|nr:glycosyltransferase [Neolewinella antarctica]NJC26136.1 glycosyltransferase involved in cell wall biosynthesis [Neolewinella antarctica]
MRNALPNEFYDGKHKPLAFEREKDWPLVSVSILAYNQRDLIGRALDSVIAQRVDFTYEIIVGDDCSDDGTQEVLLEYQRRHPDLIQLVLHPRRYQEIPGRTNNITNLMACRGKYTALLDGDDYWNNPQKLQRQVDVLEADNRYVACFHDSAYELEKGHNGFKFLPTTLNGKIGNPPSGCYGLADLVLLQNVLLKPSTLLFRTRVFGDFPDWFDRVIFADVILVSLIAERGDLYYDDQPMAIQYLNQGSFTQVYMGDDKIITGRLWELDMLVQRYSKLGDSEHLNKVRNGELFKLAAIRYRSGRYYSSFLHLLTTIQRSPVVATKRIASVLRSRIQDRRK